MLPRKEDAQRFGSLRQVSEGRGAGRRLKFFKEPPAICPQSCQDEEAYLTQASKVVITLPNSGEKTTLKDEVLKLPLAERLECVRDFGTKCLC